MYLHLGQDSAVPRAAVIGIFDLETTSQSKRTMEFLNTAQRQGRVYSVSEELPKSFVVCREGERETVYLSQLSPATLLRRWRDGLFT